MDVFRVMVDGVLIVCVVAIRMLRAGWSGRVATAEEMDVFSGEWAMRG